MAASVDVVRNAFKQEPIREPYISRTLFARPPFALFWLPIRLYLGWQWLNAGLAKINDPGWTRTGLSLRGFWISATKFEPGAKGATIHYGWYYNFLKYMLDHQWYTWFGKLIAFGETTAGIALIVGAFTALAAIFGAFMNFNYMLAGAASTNPMLLVLAVIVMLAWKVAGFIGADYVLLPAVGTPWDPGPLLPGSGHDQLAVALKRTRYSGLLAGIIMFALAGVVGVLAANQWGQHQPIVGYLVVAVAVIAAWVVTVLATARMRSHQRSGLAAGTQPATSP